MKVMIIGDLHAPYVHPNHLKFLKDQRDKEKPDTVVQIGDLTDQYCLSRFLKDPEAPGGYPEWSNAMDFLKKFYKEFPKVTWVKGNHDNRVGKSASFNNILPLYLRDLKDVYQCPPKWETCESIDIDGVNYNHGIGTGGDSSWQAYCLKIGKSSVSGHTHSISGYRFHRLDNGRHVFSMKVGSGCDDESIAMAYGKWNPKKSVLSCGFVTDGYQPHVAIMNMDERKYRRVR